MNNCRVIIVDNASQNGSGLRLKEKYANIPYCSVLLNEKNLGFARGNNIGYRYAKEQFSPEYIIVMNNDVLIDDVDFSQKIKAIHDETNFDVLGPDILSVKSGIHQNPMRLNAYTENELKQIVSQRQKWISIYPIHYTLLFARDKTKKVVKKIVGWKSKNPEDINPYSKKRRIINPVLHGACMIFSKNFIQKENDAFNPGTFLYMEEDILHYTCRAKGYRLVYDSGLSVNHIEDVSTNLEFKSEYKKRLMKYKNLVNSTRVLLELMKEDK